MSKKKDRGCMTITVLAVVAIFIICLLILRACMGGATSSKAQIIRFVIDNEELLNNAVEEIWGLDGYISRVAHARFRSRPEVDFEGLYISGVIGNELIIKPLDNPILYELLQDGRIRSINIRREDTRRGTTYQIQFAFNVRGVWDRYGGIYFSKNDEPILSGGIIWTNPEEYGDGWVCYGQSFYNTERIVPHWFYYERVANSTRTPNR